MNRVRVWDLPTRFFHWLFALAFTAAWLLGEAEGWLGWHSYFGYLVGGLVLFRLVWGFVGEEYSRFRAFPPAPRAAWRYLKALHDSKAERHLGHNPAGALAIYALLILGLATAVSGVMLMGADPQVGPLAGLVSPAWEEPLEDIHELFSNLMLLVVLAHLVGVVLGSLRHRENLPRAMVTGYKQVDSAQPHPGVIRLRAGVAAALLVAIAWFSASHDFSGGCADNPAACQNGEEHED